MSVTGPRKHHGDKEMHYPSELSLFALKVTDGDLSKLTQKREVYHEDRKVCVCCALHKAESDVDP